MSFIRILSALALIALSACTIRVDIVGEGSVASPNGTFNCSNTGGDCEETYTVPGSETLVATPASGFKFVHWSGCNTQPSLNTCVQQITQQAIDNEDELTIVATFEQIIAAVSSATYTHNALGQRITKTVNGTTTIFQYDLEGQLLGEFSSAGQPLIQHVHVDSMPIAQISTNADGTFRTDYVHTDHLETPTLITDANAAVVVGIEAAPFGEAYIDYELVDSSLRFPGQRKDDETGLSYNYFRDYDPSTGRYIQSDPIGLQGGLNTYAYVGGNPLMYTDPYGLCPAGGLLYLL